MTTEEGPQDRHSEDYGGFSEFSFFGAGGNDKILRGGRVIVGWKPGKPA